MNITEIIEALEEIREKHGDLEVHVWADHGQKCTEVWSVTETYVDSEGETIAEEDLHEFEPEDFGKVCELAG